MFIQPLLGTVACRKVPGTGVFVRASRGLNTQNKGFGVPFKGFLKGNYKGSYKGLGLLCNFHGNSVIPQRSCSKSRAAVKSLCWGCRMVDFWPCSLGLGFRVLGF